MARFAQYADSIAITAIHRFEPISERKLSLSHRAARLGHSESDAMELPPQIGDAFRRAFRNAGTLSSCFPCGKYIIPLRVLLFLRPACHSERSLSRSEERRVGKECRSRW